MAPLDPLRVLLVAPGGAVHTRRLAHALLDKGHEVVLVSHVDPLPEGRRGYRFARTPGIRGFHLLSRHVTRQLEFAIRVRQMRKIHAAARPDVVSVQGIDMRAAFCAGAALRPLVLTAWGADINDLFEQEVSDEGYQERLASMIGQWVGVREKQSVLRRYRGRVSSALRASDLVTTVTGELASRCETLAGHRLRTSIFRFGIDRSVYARSYESEATELRNRLGIPPGARILLSARTLQPLCGHPQILEAFGQLVREETTCQHVLVFHEKHTFRRELDNLKSRVDDQGLASRVFWLPADLAQETIPATYAMAEAVINYPSQDGFPVTLLEAGASRRPVVCSALEAYRATFGDAFFMAPPGDVAALVRALRDCLGESPDARAHRLRRASSVVDEIGDQDANFLGFFEQMLALVHGRGQPERVAERFAEGA